METNSDTTHTVARLGHKDMRARPRTFAAALDTVARFLRAFERKITADAVGEYRAKNRGDELESAVGGEHRPGMHPVVWASRLSARWGISLSGDADNAPEDPDAPARTLRMWWDDGWARWDEALATVERRHLARLVNDYAAFLATFAVSRENDGDVDILSAIDEPEEPSSPWVPPLPDYASRVAWRSSVWTQLSPMAHGADEKDGNTTRFRTEPRTDRLTGAVVEVPMKSGNSFRGELRDALALDMCTRVGVDPRDPTVLTPANAHALFAGGSIAAGSDGGRVWLEARRVWRSLVPMLDLLGGCVEQQVMRGQLRAADLVPVCRETASDVVDAAAPEHASDVQAWAATLPWAADLFDRRQLVRNAHKEFDDPEGSQMLVHTETIRTGTVWVHRVSLAPLDGPLSHVTASCLAHGIALLRAQGATGAQTSRGPGMMAIGDYNLGIGADEYLAHIEQNAGKIRELLAGHLLTAPTVEKPQKSTAKGKRGKGGKTDDALAVQSESALADIEFGGAEP